MLLYTNVTCSLSSPKFGFDECLSVRPVDVPARVGFAALRQVGKEREFLLCFTPLAERLRYPVGPFGLGMH